MVSVIPAVATANIQQVLNVLSLLDSAFEQNLVLGLAFLNQSQPNMICTIVNAAVNHVTVRGIYDFIQLNYHRKL